MSRKYHALSALIQIPPLGSCLLYETVRRRQYASNSLATSFYEFALHQEAERRSPVRWRWRCFRSTTSQLSGAIS
jgi:hypothetical protein